MLRLLEREKISVKWVDETFVFMEAGGTSDGGMKTRIEVAMKEKMALEEYGQKLPLITIILKKSERRRSLLFQFN